MLRSDVRTRVRDYLHESVASIWSDNQINRYFLEELRSLPTKNIYLEEKWTTSTVANQTDYTLPTGTYKVELLQRNDGTATIPSWKKINGWDNYGGVITLPYTPSTVETLRIFIKKRFTEISDDTTSLDIADDQSEVLVWGMVVRAYKQLIGYLRSNVSWDSVTRPGDLSLPVIQTWLRDALEEYKRLVLQYATTSRPRDIDLVG